jgi:hypothetical protein
VIAIAIVAKIVQVVITIVPATTTDGTRHDPANVTIDVIVNLETAIMMKVTDTSVHVTRPTMETTTRTHISAGTDTTERKSIQHPRQSSRRSQVL